jgi:hypothetical protein
MADKNITNASADSVRLEDAKQYKRPPYTPDEEKYLGRLQAMLERARNARDTAHEEFDGMTFVESWQSEEKAANTFIAPKINPEDTNFQSGIQRDNLIQIIAQVINYDMGPQIKAYDQSQLELTGLGLAMETIDAKLANLEGDDEKKVMRAYELFKHGYVDVEELWEERWQWGKKWIKKFEGRIKDASWKKKLKLLYARPVRNILSGLNVYWGDITQYDSRYQPYVFTVKYRHYDDAASEYGAIGEDGKPVWDRWHYVTRAKQSSTAPETGQSIIYNTWRLTEVTTDQVEEIRFQDKWNNEFALLLNGVLMTPLGMPLPWGYEDYNIVHQNLEPIHPFFAYGGSLIKRMKANTAIYDEFLKMGVLKTQKSFMPARFNISGKTVSRRMFMPGKITAGFKPEQLPTIDQKETEGVTQSELAMIQKLEQNISSKPSPSAGATGGRANNAVLMAQQQQAKISLGWFIFFDTLLEQKLSWVRLFNILANYFNPIDSKLDDARKTLKSQYRITSQDTNIPGKGTGTRLVVPTDEKNITAQDVKGMEDDLSKKHNRPFQVIVVQPEVIKEAEHTWEIVISQREKKTSDAAKVMFRGMMQDINAYFPNSKNDEELQEEFAIAWGKNPGKLFKPPQQVQQPGAGIPDLNMKPSAKPKIPGMPTPEKGMADAIGNSIK